MSEETNTENKKDLIGVDPLAWLSDEEKDSVQADKETELDESNILNDAESVYTVNFNSSLTIREVTALLEELKHIDKSNKEIVFEAGELERVDTAAIQLLLGFYIFAINEGKKITWDKPSEALSHAIKLLGMQDVLKLDAVSV